MIFSNGTEWDIWSSNWCASCINDEKEDCPIVLNMLLEEPTPEIVVQGPRFEDIKCLNYQKNSDVVDSEPDNPGPLPGPGQDTLF